MHALITFLVFAGLGMLFIDMIKLFWNATCKAIGWTYNTIKDKRAMSIEAPINQLRIPVVKSQIEVVDGKEYTHQTLHGIPASFDSTGCYCFQDYADGSRSWFKLTSLIDGKAHFVTHRFGGPAVEHADGVCYYYVNDVAQTPAEYIKWVNEIKNANQSV